MERSQWNQAARQVKQRAKQAIRPVFQKAGAGPGARLSWPDCLAARASLISWAFSWADLSSLMILSIDEDLFFSSFIWEEAQRSTSQNVGVPSGAWIRPDAHDVGWPDQVRLADPWQVNAATLERMNKVQRDFSHGSWQMGLNQMAKHF